MDIRKCLISQVDVNEANSKLYNSFNERLDLIWETISSDFADGL